jgi:hypothetical protein
LQNQWFFLDQILQRHDKSSRIETQKEDPMPKSERFGRLVLVFEKQLSDASRGTLRGLLAHMWKGNEVTWVAGMSRASALQAGVEGGNIFYNRDFIAPEQAVQLMPWREVWLVAAGKVWKLEEA